MGYASICKSRNNKAKAKDEYVKIVCHMTAKCKTCVREWLRAKYLKKDPGAYQHKCNSDLCRAKSRAGLPKACKPMRRLRSLGNGDFIKILKI
jgi:hypothetical protein